MCSSNYCFRVPSPLNGEYRMLSPRPVRGWLMFEVWPVAELWFVSCGNVSPFWELGYQWNKLHKGLLSSGTSELNQSCRAFLILISTGMEDPTCQSNEPGIQIWLECPKCFLKEGLVCKCGLHPHSISAQGVVHSWGWWHLCHDISGGEASMTEATQLSVGGRHAFLRQPCYSPTTWTGGGFHTWGFCTQLSLTCSQPIGDVLEAWSGCCDIPVSWIFIVCYLCSFGRAAP